MLRLIKRESGEGIVCAVGNGRIFVAPLLIGNADKAPPPKAKKGCGAASGCGSCGGCLPVDPASGGYVGRFCACVDDCGNYYPGDRVRFERFVPEPNLISALVFGVPVAFALAATLFWIANAPERVESALAVFTVIAALFTGILIVSLIDRLFKAKYPAAIISTRNDNDGISDADVIAAIGNFNNNHGAIGENGSEGGDDI